ncbi:hypothetical protein FGO68_gene7002 [Halteria grandinella]|uniref:Uncharacterized protein n=1 Tax=Halteria grandinella TaxID=5974 RepID=A0A8J8T970_HALGN|nr:hypothetical protein FGO68_gene7002 [Halteria grandinella]
MKNEAKRRGYFDGEDAKHPYQQRQEYYKSRVKPMQMSALSSSFESHSQRMQRVNRDFQPYPKVSTGLSSLQISQNYASATQRKDDKLSRSVDQSLLELAKQSRNARVLEYIDNIDEIWDQVVLKKNCGNTIRRQASIVTITTDDDLKNNTFEEDNDTVRSQMPPPSLLLK